PLLQWRDRFAVRQRDHPLIWIKRPATSAPTPATPSNFTIPPEWCHFVSVSIVFELRQNAMANNHSSNPQHSLTQQGLSVFRENAPTLWSIPRSQRLDQSNQACK